jgi:hypothetical protein
VEGGTEELRLPDKTPDKQKPQILDEPMTDESQNNRSLNPEEELAAETAPPLLSVVAMGNKDLQFPESLKGRYSEDKFFKTVIDKPEQYRNFEVIQGIIFLRESDRRILCIPDVKIGGQNVREIIISHSHSILAHLGTRKTLYHLRDNVWWPSMVEDVRSFCDSCTLCAASKVRNHEPYGLLNSLQVPSRPWQTIGIDFVGPLPESKNRLGAFDMITVIIDHFTGMVILVPSKRTYRAKQIAELIFENVYSKHGLPRAIVSDRDSLFTSIFWEQLHKLIGTELRMSSACDGTGEPNYRSDASRCDISKSEGLGC